MRHGRVPPAPSRRSSGLRLSRWPVVLHAHTANPGHAGRGRNSPKSPSSSRSWCTSRQERFAPGCARTRSNLGGITRGSARPIPALWTRLARCSISTNTPRRWRRKGKRSCAVMRRPPSKPASVSVRPRQRRQGTPSTWRIGIKGWAPWYHLKNPGLKAHALAGCHAGRKLA